MEPHGNTPSATLDAIAREVVTCRRCPRLTEWRERAAREKTRRFADWEYWARPVPAFGAADARMALVGLAPAAHGANRTGRMFTGDRSGDFLYAALHRTGFASRAESVSRDDGLEPLDCIVTAACRCASPVNKPTPEELRNCADFIQRELLALKRLRMVVGLGRIGFDAAFNALLAVGIIERQKRPKFGHAVEAELAERLWLIGSFHPSQQNTFTGRLTPAMLDAVFARARTLLDRQD